MRSFLVQEQTRFIHRQLDNDERQAQRLLAGARKTVEDLKAPRLLGKEIPGWGYWRDVVKLCNARISGIKAQRAALEILDEMDNSGQCDVRQVISAMLRPYAGRVGWDESW